MEKETLRMQFLSGVITESEYKVKLEENAASNLELKSLAKQLYLGFKKLGAAPKLLTTKMEIGKKGSWEDGVNVTIFSGEDVISININSKGIGVPKAEEIKNNIEKSFPKATFTPVNGGKDWEGNPIISFNITPGKDMSESLNEHYIAGGIVGVGAINNPFEGRKKEVYEDAFEYFLSSKYELNEAEETTNIPSELKNDPNFEKLVDYFKQNPDEAEDVQDELSSLKEGIYRQDGKYYKQEGTKTIEISKKEYIKDKLISAGLSATVVGLVGALMAGPLGVNNPSEIIQAVSIAAGIGAAAGGALEEGKEEEEPNNY
jgi:hypothetical protein